jgi:hypothetical protein
MMKIATVDVFDVVLLQGPSVGGNGGDEDSIVF